MTERKVRKPRARSGRKKVVVPVVCEPVCYQDYEALPRFQKCGGGVRVVRKNVGGV